MIVVGITGASGPILGIRLVEELLNAGEAVSSIVSNSAWDVIQHEMSFTPPDSSPLKAMLQKRDIVRSFDKLHEYKNDDFFAPVASGSSPLKAVVVIPSSMKTLSAVSHGYADSLITRACDVALKEKKTCIIVPRETPLSVIHIENMLALAHAGAIMLPPVLGFYSHPNSVDELINFIVGKVLNILGIKHSLFACWGDNQSQQS
jgi:4-hydroxy-3-polyprenylbenzoate decarboxylase